MTIKQESSRAIAFEILQEVVRKRQPFDEVLEHHAGLNKLEKRDRAFVHAMVAVVLRRMGQIDDAIQACLDKPQELKAKPQDILRLGAAQLLFMDTPPHAAVDTLVEFAAADNSTAPYKGLINAVLRRLSREGKALVEKQDAARLNTPAWLWLSWRLAYGVGKAREIAMANLGEAMTDVTAKSGNFQEYPLTPTPLPQSQAIGGEGLPPRSMSQTVFNTGAVEPLSPPLRGERGWGEGGGESINARQLPTGSFRLYGDAPVTEIAGFAEGDWWVQDAAAALPVKLLGDVSGQSVIDLCAAPGGKTMQLAAAGANVTAVDRSEKRLQRLKANLARSKLEAEVVCADALSYLPEKKAQLVLLDAPCSATGTIRRHPDVLRLKHTEDVARMAELQHKLLNHAFHRVLASGGTLVYAVCSLQPEEGERQISDILQLMPTVRRVPITPDEVGGVAEFITPSGDLRCLPCQWAEFGGIDGFFAARLRLGL